MTKLLLTYLKEKIWNLVLVVLFFSAFGVVYYLYGEHTETFLYSIILCLFIGIIIFFVRFRAFVKRHYYFKEKLALIETEYKNLPEPRTLTEKDFQEMITTLGDKCSDLNTQFEKKQQDSLDYYTTWVHQIKTPISVMQMMLGIDDTEDHRALSTELFRIEQYVEMVLNYIRLGSTTNDFVLKEYTLNLLIRSSIRKYATQFIQKRITLNYEPSNYTIVTDAKWYSFIIEQLLSNAVKYTYSGSVNVMIQENGSVSISDTGIGIASEDLPRIFEKGYTGYNGHSEKKSTGLGLYLCKSIADKLGITLSVTSEPGKGSCFTVSAPDSSRTFND